MEGDSPVRIDGERWSACLPRVELFGIAALMGGKFHLKLNMGGRPIANKYREGKMKRTLKRE
jgi:hypothetical protein